MDVSRAREWFGFEARTSFDDGLRRTIEWYLTVGQING
jgi:GDP-L-fucose synthase